MTLADLGWDEGFSAAFQPWADNGWIPARLIRDNKISCGALWVDEDEDCFQEAEVVLSGKVWHDAETDADLPAVGDWVALDIPEEDGADIVIRARLPRRTCFSRKAPGQSTEEQVIAANVDRVIVVTDPGPDYNPRRLERYFTLIDRSGAACLVVLNKADLHGEDHIDQCVAEIQSMHPAATVHVTSVITDQGFKALRAQIEPGSSTCFIGSSGVGKSAMINRLLGGDFQWTSEVNPVTGKGRHTTTARELMVLRGGGIVIDNPGIREVHLWTDESTLRERFADISAIATECQFHDCKHGGDRGCAIRAAVTEGRLDARRYQAFLKLEEEIAHLRQRRKKRQMTVERRGKRERKVVARVREDRTDHERDLTPRARDW